MCARHHMNRRVWSQLLSQLGLSVLVFHLILGSGSLVDYHDVTYYWESDVDALQAVFGAWNTSTPDLETNLAGWSSSQRYPCQNLTRYEESWAPTYRGVLCWRHHDRITQDWVVDIVGLSLSSASIVGTLSPYIGNLASVSTLQLTGNPNLTGPVPDTLGGMWLNILDLHGNGFNGTIPGSLINLRNLLQLDLSGNKLTGEYLFKQTQQMHSLQVLRIGGNNFSGVIPANAFENKTELQILDVSNSGFIGALLGLNFTKENLQYLDVSGNGFVGPVPDLTEFAKLSTANLDNNTLSGTLDISKMLESGSLKQKYSSVGAAQNSTGRGLIIMSLRNNNLLHVVSNRYAIANTTTVFMLQGNPYCDNYNPEDDAQRCYCTQYCYITPATLRSDCRKNAIIAAVSSVVAVVLILSVIVGAILYKNRRYKQHLQLQFEKKFEEFDVKPTIFRYNELRAATRDFHEDMKLGQGGYGAVYKGVLSNGNVVAVKLLYIKNMSIGMDEFLNEVVLITGMKHRNLVNLKGCCLRENQRLLVYEYVDNYDVDQIVLEKGSRREVVSWPVRLAICVGIARGLHYLHALAYPRVIHRDIKASNVLLDKNLEPKLADFGLALLFPDERTHIMTVHVAGTKGYLAPEYASLGQLSDKADVYSFGVLCLEIISGRRNIDETAHLDQVYLSQWAWELHEENRLLDLVDPSLQLTDEELRDVERVINVCLLCIQQAADKRPTMARIVHILQSDNESDVQVLRASKGDRPLFESLMSQRSADYRILSAAVFWSSVISEQDNII